jgi:hypothetical protein
MSITQQKSPNSEREPFFRFSDHDKQHFLMLFIANMTVAVRDAYLLKPEESTGLLKSWNELLHRLASTLLALFENSASRFPDEIIFKMIRSEKEMDKQVAWALERSYTLLEKSRTENATVSREIAPAH